jgi:hypothetical protein
MNQIITELDAEERTRLANCEAIIALHIKSYEPAGNALRIIRDEKLYRREYWTFEEYCEKRWSLDRTYCYRLINAAETRARLLPVGDNLALPVTEKQVRPLNSLPPEQQAEAWKSSGSWARQRKKECVRRIRTT